MFDGTVERPARLCALAPVDGTAKGDCVSRRATRLDRINEWSEVKLEIVRKYAAAYSTILSKQPGFTHFYIDGFAGAGEHVSKTTGKVIPGSPLSVLSVRPPFDRYFLVDRNRRRVSHLRELIGTRDNVEFRQGDCNELLLKEILPQVRWNLRRRALCLLDPYGVHLTWNVLAKAGQIGTVDLLLNFPIMDMNMNALLNNPAKVKPREAARMTAFWGDDSWKDITYRPSPQGNLFGEHRVQKLSNDAVVEAFCRRLRTVAGFRCVAQPVAMRNSTNAVVYYLVFASGNETACRVVRDIFRHYREGYTRRRTVTP